MTTTNLSFQLTDTKELPTALNWLDGHFSEAGADAGVNADLKQLLNAQVQDVFSHHAHEPRSVEMHVELELDRGQVLLRLIDNGQPYNPLSNGLSAKNQGGASKSCSCGAVLIQELTDAQSYRRRHEHNVLELTRHFLPG
ncbi:ATP-binding protein [Marinobacter fonticola]|uniref:ATP-binding protein n=1 Tax=Marinobacter fonticola TaxID=2603215 RepID=UPI0011E77D89|nr:ATP-binding protein [Marinobacter fonticola]